MKKNITLIGAGHFGMVLHDLLAPHHRLTLIKRGDDIALAATDIFLVALPVKEYDAVFAALARTTATLPPTILFSKGMNQAGLLPMAIINRHFPRVTALAVLAGPNFATELRRGLPTASVLASHDARLISMGQELLQRPFWRIYPSPDPVGVQLNGAMKNILAIAVGIARGKQLGENAYASLITRGLFEMKKLLLAEKMAEKMGPSNAQDNGARAIDETTCYGLSGVGDLVLTAGSAESRNTALGIKLGQGLGVAEALSQSLGVAEGYHAAAHMARRASELNLDLPIVATVARVLHDNVEVNEAIKQLLARPMPRKE